MRTWTALLIASALAACNGGTVTDGGIDASDIAVDATDASADAIDATDTTMPMDCDGGTYIVGDASSTIRVPACHGFDTLSQYGFFVGNLADLRPAPGVIPYDVNAPLFSDYALKQRFLFVPPGEHIGFVPNERWVMPVGSVVIKVFMFPVDARNPALGRRIVETRLLIRDPDGFHQETYVWNDAQTEAMRSPVSAVIPLTWIDATGTVRNENFQPPNYNECGSCHGPGTGTSTDPMNVLGVRTGQLNRTYDYGGGVVENQIDHLAALGLFDTTPPPSSMLERFSDPFGTDPPEARARAYLQSNCAHCHHPGTARDSSGLVLAIENTNAYTFGVCKQANAADSTCGLVYDIVPGHPEQSVMLCRMQLTHSSSMMPPLGRTVAHTEGMDVVSQWIATLSGSCP